VYDVVDAIVLQEADHSWRYHPKRSYLSRFIDTHFTKCVSRNHATWARPHAHNHGSL
jgi:hypothetical protein